MTTFSIIVPVYRVERFIGVCLASVMAQTYDDAECIIVDDASPDASMDIALRMIAEYRGNIAFRTIRHDKNRGLPNARNTGINAATGEYLVLLDSDDTLTTDALETLAQIAGRHPGCHMIQCGVDNHHQQIWLTDALPDYTEGPYKAFDELTAKHLPWTVHGKAVCRQWLLEERLTFDPDIIIHEDLYWTYHVARRTVTLATSPHVIYNYTADNEGSIMQQSATHFERSARYYAEILDRLTADIAPTRYADSRLFLENLFFYVYTKALDSDDLTPGTLQRCQRIRRRLLTSALRRANLCDVIYLLHLYAPLRRLLRCDSYRRRWLYRYEKMARWCYDVWPATRLSGESS